MNKSVSLSPSEAPLTPDFIAHPWVPLASAQLANGFVDLEWSDGLAYRAYALWLFENADGIGIEPSSREGMVEPGTLPQASALRWATVDAQGTLCLTWQQGQNTRIHPGWLRYVAQGGLSANNNLPEQRAWQASAFQEPPTVEGSNITNDSGRQKEWLEQLVQYGLCRLQNTPACLDFLQHFMQNIGVIRASNFGLIFDVQTKPNPDSTAYTGLNLGQHTDLPTRETPPGFQFLHCVENTVQGGHSRMTDGLAIVNALRAEHPQAFALLTQEKWIFMNRAQDAEHRWEGPMIELPVHGRPLTLRAFYPVRSAPLMDEALVPAAYEAMRVFSQYAHNPRFQIAYPFRAGDLVGFDNRRVMHGRDAFDSIGSRHLRGCYMDHDEVYSRLRVLQRPSNTTGKSLCTAR